MKQKIFGMMLVVYAASTVLFSIIGTMTVDIPDFSFTAADLAVMSLESSYPGALQNLEAAETSGEESTGGEQSQEDTIPAAEVKAEPEKTPEPVVFGKDPAVLIVHTHATETYLPASAGNYHSTEKENSVRDVGEALAQSLEEEGISVVHDETLHDNPSYSSSYSRSYETISGLLDRYPTVTCVIDLHRDAVESENAGGNVSISGKTCARYMYVVSTAVPTYGNNLKFVNALNKTAQADFSGFTGSILERGYAYNQNLSDKYLLLEIGSNRNQIEEARNTARVFGKILAKTMKAGY